jgi:5,10-methenyltetrahydrofolate synthetase
MPSPSPTPDPDAVRDALRAAKQSLRLAMRHRREEQAVRMVDPAVARSLDERASAEALRVIGGEVSPYALLYAATPGEAPTTALDAALRAMGWTVCYPRIVSRRPALLEARETPSLSALRPGSYGILEPPPDDAACSVVAPQTIDLVIVPGLAFDRAGGRLGQGAGFYDAFLPHCQIARKLGLAFDWQIVDAVPMNEERDVSLNGVIVVDSRVGE